MRPRSAILSAITVGALGVVLAGAGPALSAFPGVNGKIAFTSSRGGNTDVWVMDANGARGAGADTLAARDGQRDIVDGGPGRDRGRWDRRDEVRAVELRANAGAGR